MDLDAIISGTAPKPQKDWYGKLEEVCPETARVLMNAIEAFFEGESDRILDTEHLSRVISIAAGQKGVKITPSGAKTWLKKHRMN